MQRSGAAADGCRRRQSHGAGQAVRKSRRAGHGQRFRYTGPPLREILQSIVVQQRGAAVVGQRRRDPAVADDQPRRHGTGPSGRARAGGHQRSVWRPGTEHRPACRRPLVVRPVDRPLPGIGIGVFLSGPGREQPVVQQPEQSDSGPAVLQRHDRGPGFAVDRLSQRLQRHITANSTENFEAAEALWRRAIVHGSDGRIDLLAGIVTPR